MLDFKVGFQIQKPLQQDTIPTSDGIETKPNPAENTYKNYADCAEWCNKNNAYIEDKGDWFEVVAVPEKTLDEIKDLKHSELKSAMQTKRQALKVDYDDDQFDANDQAQANMLVLLKLFDLGTETVSIRSATEKTHNFNKEQCTTLSLMMANSVNDLYVKYWELKDELSKCETADEVEKISF